jgi:hypothetical protein
MASAARIVLGANPILTPFIDLPPGVARIWEIV